MSNSLFWLKLNYNFLVSEKSIVRVLKMLFSGDRHIDVGTASNPGHLQLNRKCYQAIRLLPCIISEVGTSGTSSLKLLTFLRIKIIFFQFE